MTTIRGLAELLAGATPEEREETLVPALIRNARRAERLLDDLLIAAEIDTARPTVPAAPVDLAPLVENATAGTSVVVTGAPDGPVLAHADSVGHALAHLVDNAHQYADGVPTLGFDHDDGTVTVEIATPVEGDLPDLELGFELFFRGEQAVTRAAGLGVGLPVARSLARLDGGDITIGRDGDAVVTRLALPRAR